jgi:hypothetical protein
MKLQDKQPNLFRPLPFYHAEPGNAGIAISFSYNSTEDKLYLNLLRQNGWDETTKRGTFSGEDKRVVKFSQIEAASLAEIITNGGSLHLIHQFNGITNNISIEWSDGEELILSINQRTAKGEERFMTELTSGEAHLLRIYIESAIKESFWGN